jgi:hypothetical protein
MTSAPASGLAERNQRHDLDGFNVGLNLSYVTPPWPRGSGWNNCTSSSTRGGGEREEGTTHTGARREGRRSAGEVVLLAAASPDVAFVLGSRLSLASASSVTASASCSRVIASIRRGKLDVCMRSRPAVISRLPSWATKQEPCHGSLARPLPARNRGISRTALSDALVGNVRLVRRHGFGIDRPSRSSQIRRGCFAKVTDRKMFVIERQEHRSASRQINQADPGESLRSSPDASVPTAHQAVVTSHQCRWFMKQPQPEATAPAGARGPRRRRGCSPLATRRCLTVRSPSDASRPALCAPRPRRGGPTASPRGATA